MATSDFRTAESTVFLASGKSLLPKSIKLRTKQLNKPSVIKFDGSDAEFHYSSDITAVKVAKRDFDGTGIQENETEIKDSLIRCRNVYATESRDQLSRLDILKHDSLNFNSENDFVYQKLAEILDLAKNSDLKMAKCLEGLRNRFILNCGNDKDLDYIVGQRINDLAKTYVDFSRLKNGIIEYYNSLSTNDFSPSKSDFQQIESEMKEAYKIVLG